MVLFGQLVLKMLQDQHVRITHKTSPFNAPHIDSKQNVMIPKVVQIIVNGVQTLVFQPLAQEL